MLALSACGGLPVRAGSLDTPGGDKVVSASETVKFAISDDDRHRADILINVFWIEMPERALTGPVWAQIFTGHADNGPSFTITHATIRELPALVWWDKRHRYHVNGTLSFGGRQYPVRAEGRDSDHSMSTAVWNRVAEAARQVAAIISTTPAWPKGMAAELRDLEDLRTKGTITDAEFEARKKRLLDAR